MEADTVVLDVDGVLVDVADSYRRAVVETVRRRHGVEPPREAIQPLKNAGGFNNDWLVTDALTLYTLTRQTGYDADPAAFGAAVADAGGGLDGVDATLTAALGDDYPDVRDQWDPDGVRATFQALYLGAALYREIEGGDPPVETDGLIHDEPVIVSRATIRALTDDYPVCVLTGRPA
ncbi:MAG: hypothetical protein J07HB67_00012, partial [halophilic archaeon J07HB67]